MPFSFLLEDSRVGAKKAIWDVSGALVLIALVKVAFFLAGKSFIFPGAIPMGVFGALLFLTRSRIVAVALLAYGLFVTISTLVSYRQHHKLDELHAVVSLVLCFVGCQAVEATFKLNGRYKNPEPQAPPSADAPPGQM